MQPIDCQQPASLACMLLGCQDCNWYGTHNQVGQQGSMQNLLPTGLVVDVYNMLYLRASTLSLSLSKLASFN